MLEIKTKSGYKFDLWEDPETGKYGVWNNDMNAKQFVHEWDGVTAPDQTEAIIMASNLNEKWETLN